MPDTRHQRSRHAARLGETPRTNQKTAASEGEGRRIGKHLVRAGTQEHPTHEPLISRATRAEVPLAGLSFKMSTATCALEPRGGGLFGDLGPRRERAGDDLLLEHSRDALGDQM